MDKFIGQSRPMVFRKSKINRFPRKPQSHFGRKGHRPVAPSSVPRFHRDSSFTGSRWMAPPPAVHKSPSGHHFFVIRSARIARNTVLGFGQVLNWSEEELFNSNETEMELKTCAVLFGLLAVAVAQFPNGRILEPPVPQLCAQRVIHERTPDGKFCFSVWIF